MRPHAIIPILTAAALFAGPSIASAAPDPNTTNGRYNTCYGGRWINGQCVYNQGPYNNGQWNNGPWNNGQWNNGPWNHGEWNNGQWNHRHGDDEDEDENSERDDDHGRNGGWWHNPNPYNNGGYNNGGYYNDGYYNGGYNGDQCSGTISSFAPYGLYLRNGMRVRLNNRTVIHGNGVGLAAGQSIRVRGHRKSDGTIVASVIDLVRSINGGR